MLIDQGGAQIRDEPIRYRERDTGPRITARKIAEPNSTVTVVVSETHDGAPCDCIDKELVLEIGQELELTHVCHDGRVDKVIAKVKAIKTVPGPPEHGSATAR